MATRTKTVRSEGELKKAKKSIKAHDARPARRKRRAESNTESTFDPLARFPDENPNPVMRVGEGGRLLYANKASALLLKQWGCKKGGTLPPEWKKRIEEALSSLKPFSVDEPIGKRLYAMDVVPIKDAGYANVYGRDMTERMRAEEILKENEERFMILFELAPDAYYLSDFKGNFVDGNKAAEELLGYERHELIGKSFLKLKILGPDQIKKAAALVAKNIIRESTGPDEFVLNRKNGSQVTVEIRTHPVTIHNKTLVLGIARDITERKRAEEALRCSETKFRTLYDSSSDAVMLLDQKGFFDCNQATLKIFGCSTREEFCSKHPADVSPPTQPDRADSQTLADQKIGMAMEKGSLHFEWMHQRVDTGETFPAEVLLSAMELDGRPVLQAVVRGIAERKRADEALRESEVRFRELFNRMSSGVAVYEAIDNGGDFIFRDFNPAAEKIEKVNRKDIIGKRVSEVFPGVKAFGIFDVFQRVWQTGKPEYFPQNIYKDGRDPGSWRESWIFKLPTGEIIAIYDDITERKRAEEELRESKALIEAVVENVPLMIFLKEATDLRFVIFNRAGEELLGYDRKALLGKNNLDLFPPEQAAHFMAKDREVLDGEAGILDIPEEPIQTARKGQRLLHTRKVCIRGPDGTTKYLLGISEDITERRQAEEKLKTLLKEKELLVREVHHRVKNNFMVVSSLLGLQSQQVEDQGIQDMFMKSRDRIRSMALIHERLYQSEDLTHVDLSEYIRTLAAELYESYGTDPAKVSLVIEAEDVTLNLDQAIPCGLIVNELVSNALKYGFPSGWNGEGRVEVTLRRIEEDQIELAVKDNGVGLPDDFNIGKTKSLGLKIMALLAKDQLGGELRINRNEGTQFVVRFDVEK
jgi:PAS domain S-box-containing protein